MNIEELLFNLFVNRSDVLAIQGLNNKTKKKEFYRKDEPITFERIKNHLEGKDFLGVYQLNKESMIKWICLDFDKDTEEDYNNAVKLYNFIKEKGFHPLAENSGGGDFKIHIWIFCNLTKAYNGKSWANEICKECNIFPHEIFPKQNSIKEDGYGSLLKLPLGINLVSNNKSFFYPKEANIRDLLKHHLDNLDTIPVYPEKEKEIKKEQEQPKPVEVTEILKNPYDDFFNFCLNNELPSGISVEDEVKTISGINNNILKNQAIWFFKKGYTLEKLENEIKPIYESKGWVFNDLKGWFKKAEKGEIKKIARGELVEWCKKYENLLSLLPFEKFYLTPNELKFITFHLPEFSSIHDIIKLKGSIYDIIKKEAYNCLISLAIPKELKKIRIGDLETDTRVHPLLILKSGKGKLEVKEGIKNVFLKFNPNANIKEQTNPHKEQLYGKVLKRKVRINLKDASGNPILNNKGENKTKTVIKYIKKYGFAFADLLIIEEAYEILSSDEKNEVDCRDVFLKSLDIFGKNFIEKQNIDNIDSVKETISGYPEGNCLAFCQPLNFPDRFITKGLARRFKMIYRDFPLRTESELFKERLEGSKRNQEESINKIVNLMKKINSLKGNWEFEEGVIEAIQHYHSVLLENGFIQGGKIANYTSILEFPLQNDLVKYSCLRAIGKGSLKVIIRDVKEAFIDIIERLVFEFLFIENKVSGTFDYGNNWKSTGKKQEILEWLYNQGGTSKETSTVTIDFLKKQISNIYGISIRRAQDRLNEMMEENLIQTKKPSPKNRLSRVWLTFNPELQKGQKSQKGQINIKEEYQKAIQYIENQVALDELNK